MITVEEASRSPAKGHHSRFPCLGLRCCSVCQSARSEFTIWAFLIWAMQVAECCNWTLGSMVLHY